MESTETTNDLLRAIRLHSVFMISQVEEGVKRGIIEFCVINLYDDDDDGDDVYWTSRVAGQPGGSWTFDDDPKQERSDYDALTAGRIKDYLKHPHNKPWYGSSLVKVPEDGELVYTTSEGWSFSEDFQKGNGAGDMQRLRDALDVLCDHTKGAGLDIHVPALRQEFDRAIGGPPCEDDRLGKTMRRLMGPKDQLAVVANFDACVREGAALRHVLETHMESLMHKQRVHQTFKQNLPKEELQFRRDVVRARACIAWLKTEKHTAVLHAEANRLFHRRCITPERRDEVFQDSALDDLDQMRLMVRRISRLSERLYDDDDFDQFEFESWAPHIWFMTDEMRVSKQRGALHQYAIDDENRPRLMFTSVLILLRRRMRVFSHSIQPFKELLYFAQLKPGVGSIFFECESEYNVTETTNLAFKRKRDDEEQQQHEPAQQD
tara:strand:- start:1544 stop:2845 length:1302 start_codon:yes stop_codon:yes gene_type:complete